MHYTLKKSKNQTTVVFFFIKNLVRLGKDRIESLFKILAKENPHLPLSKTLTKIFFTIISDAFYCSKKQPSSDSLIFWCIMHRSICTIGLRQINWGCCYPDGQWLPFRVPVIFTPLSLIRLVVVGLIPKTKQFFWIDSVPLHACLSPFGVYSIHQCIPKSSRMTLFRSLTSHSTTTC